MNKIRRYAWISMVVLTALASTSRARAADPAGWTVEIHARVHGVDSSETWVGETFDGVAVVRLGVDHAGSVTVPLSPKEAAVLAFEIAPLGRKKDSGVEPCVQYLRVRSQFGTRTFCSRQVSGDSSLADLAAKLEGLRRRAITASSVSSP